MPATQYEAYGEETTWNSQLQVKTYSLRMPLLPDKPRIAGKVETVQVGTKPLSNVTLMLLSNYKQSSEYNVLVRTAKTDAKGYYEFDNLDVELGNYSTVTYTEVTGPNRTMFCFPSGFKGKAFPYGILLWGRQIIEDILLEPDGLLTGYVTDEKGIAVAADIQVDDLAFASTTAQFEYGQSAGGSSSGGGTQQTGAQTTGGGTQQTGAQPAGSTIQSTGFQTTGGVAQQMAQQSTYQSFMPTGVKQVFSINAPSGKERTLTIIPKNPGYSEETFPVIRVAFLSRAAG